MRSNSAVIDSTSLGSVAATRAQFSQRNVDNQRKKFQGPSTANMIAFRIVPKASFNRSSSFDTGAGATISKGCSSFQELINSAPTISKRSGMYTSWAEDDTDYDFNEKITESESPPLNRNKSALPVAMVSTAPVSPKRVAYANSVRVLPIDEDSHMEKFNVNQIRSAPLQFAKQIMSASPIPKVRSTPIAAPILKPKPKILDTRKSIPVAIRGKVLPSVPEAYPIRQTRKLSHSELASARKRLRIVLTPVNAGRSYEIVGPGIRKAQQVAANRQSVMTSAAPLSIYSFMFYRGNNFKSRERAQAFCAIQEMDYLDPSEDSVSSDLDYI